MNKIKLTIWKLKFTIWKLKASYRIYKLQRRNNE